MVFDKFLNKDTSPIEFATDSSNKETDNHDETRAFVITLCMNLMGFTTILCLFRGIRKRRGDRLIGSTNELKAHAKNQETNLHNSWKATAEKNVSQK